MRYLFFLILFFVSQAHASLLRRCDLSNTEKLNKNSFDHCTQRQLDNFYKTLKAGSAIPSGSFDGKVQIAKKSLIEDLLSGIFNESVERFLERLWKGKIFYRSDLNHAVLFNRVFSENGKLAFPAHVYYGRSLFDSTKLSIVIDYKYNQDIEGYNNSTDWLVNEEGLSIRDEIRVVRSGLYLGRAYSGNKFLLNFVLEKAKAL